MKARLLALAKEAGDMLQTQPMEYDTCDVGLAEDDRALVMVSSYSASLMVEVKDKRTGRMWFASAKPGAVTDESIRAAAERAVAAIPEGALR